MPEALRNHQRSIVAHQDLGQQAFVVHELESFAFIAQAQSQPERAIRLLGAAEALRERIGISIFGVERLEDEYHQAVAWLHTQFNESDYRLRWAEARAMNVDQAISYALER